MKNQIYSKFFACSKFQKVDFFGQDGSRLQIYLQIELEKNSFVFVCFSFYKTKDIFLNIIKFARKQILCMPNENSIKSSDKSQMNIQHIFHLFLQKDLPNLSWVNAYAWKIEYPKLNHIWNEKWKTSNKQ